MNYLLSSVCVESRLSSRSRETDEHLLTRFITGNNGSLHPLAEMDKSEPEDFSLHSDERKSLQFYFDTGNDAISEIAQVGRE